MRYQILQSWSLEHRLFAVFDLFYVLLQYIIIWVFKPPPPPSPEYPKLPKGRIAIIGAGLTGVSSAAHAIAHGFDVVIYEQSKQVGGIWANVNKTSGLQINSFMYRFHPAVLWSSTYPYRNEVLSEIRRIWKEYQLEPRTRLNTPVTSVRRVPGTGIHLSGCSDEGRSRWLINDGEDGAFDAIVVAVGSCGKPKRANFPGMPNTHSQHDGVEKKHKGGDGGEVFEGDVYHSTELDKARLEGKTVIVIGSGASGVEAVETALARGANHCVMLAREDKWIIPRNMIIDALLSFQLYGLEKPLSLIWQKIIVFLNYRRAPELVPARLGIFEGTPVVNDEFVGWVKEGKCDYFRCDIMRFTKEGVQFKVRGRTERPGEGKEIKEIKGDVAILATGFQKPPVDFFKDDLFPGDYARPNLYMLNFSTEDWSVLMTNSSYEEGIGSVGHFHIGMYIRVLLTFLMDPNARPTPKDMKLWVDAIRFIKRDAPGGALSFFLYTEFTIWFLSFHMLRLSRLKWWFFIMFGWGVYPKEYTQANIPKAQWSYAPQSESLSDIYNGIYNDVRNFFS